MITEKVLNAKRYAIKAHGTQTYGEFPYALHLQAVESVLIRFGVITEELLCAAWLHDVLEDTECTYEEMAVFFGDDVANIVAALTEPKGGNREWRHAQTYPRIKQNMYALLVKLADRISNVESGGPKVQMYVKEHPSFKQALYIERPSKTSVESKMWDHLDGLIIAL